MTMPTVKEYLIEQGARREVALEMDEIVSAIRYRVTKFNKEGVEKHQILMDIGKYRHLDQKNPLALPQLMRITFDLSLLVVRFEERMRALEHFDFIRFNPLTAEYQLTDFAKQFYDTPAT